MGFSNRKKIALFMSVVHNHYQRDMIRRLSLRLNGAGYYLFVFSVNGAYGNNDAYVNGENVMTELPAYDNFDGILLALDTFGNEDVREIIYNKVKQDAKCPVVSIRRECGTYNCVLVDDDNSMTSIVRHIVEVHNYRDLFFISGPKEHPDAMKRLKCYKKTLAEYDITVNDEDIIYGNFWNTGGHEYVEEMLRRRNGKLPDAIVCANDYMAIAVCNELSERGIKVPNDVAVTGFDDIKDAAMTEPPLTSVRVSVEELADAAADMILGMIAGTQVKRREYIKTATVPRVSCGCELNNLMVNLDSLHAFYVKSEMAKHENLQTVFMSIETETSCNIDKLNEIISRYIYNNRNFRDFFVILNDYMKVGELSKTEETAKAFQDTMRVYTAIKDKQLVEDSNDDISPSELLPDRYIDEKPCTYYVSMVHYLDRIFGYSLIRFEEEHTAHEFLQYFLTTIGTAIERIRSDQNMKTLVERLSYMYVSDATTGLKNRHGFDEDSVAMYERLLRDGGSMAIISIDMDGLKTVNDSYGHNEGDVSLLAIANAIKSACFSSEQCYRVGGDEFQVLAMDYSENSVRKFIKRFDAALEEFNAKSGKNYIVQASCGYAMCTPDVKKTLREWLTASDNNMYAMKEKNKLTRRIIR